MDILEIKNVAYSYENSKEKVLSGVDQKFELGKFYAIVGKSGTGKTTLLSLLAGLDKPKTGKILFKNEDIQKKGYNNHRKNNISLVFQNYNLIDYLTPIENIRLVNKSADESILFELGLDKKQIKTSEERLPSLDEESQDVVNGLLDYAGEREWLENGSVLQRGFQESVVCVEVGEYLSGVRVSGPVILYASSMLFVEENNRLENVIIVGDRVEFADGFSGCVQVFARDTILLGNQVCLKAGSGLYVRQGEEKGFIRLGEECEVNGYVIAGAKVSEGEQKQLLYYQPESSRVRGL